MKIAIIADIHANHSALQAVLADIILQNVQEIISLGDNIGYGPDPGQVVNELLINKVISIMGNHEYGLLSDGYFKKLNPSPQKSLLINRNLMSEEELAYCLGLPPLLLRHNARFVHGCPPKSLTAYLYQVSNFKLEKLYTGFKEPICFHGHTHTPTLFEGTVRYDATTLYNRPHVLQDDKRYLINPGSVGQPRDGENNYAKYLIWDMEEATITFRAVNYKVATTVERLRNLGFPDFNSERLLL